MNASGNITQFALNNSALLNTNPVLTTVFPATGLANQLLQVAKLISLSSSLGLKRQIFFCSIGGFDTHTVQLSTEMTLLQQLSDAMAAFYKATIELGVSSKVTTFTLSDFNRTFKPAGTVATTVGPTMPGAAIISLWAIRCRRRLLRNIPGPGGWGKPECRFRSERARPVDSHGLRGRVRFHSGAVVWIGEFDLQIVFPNVGKFATANLGFMM